jgi:hypothetical protein
MIMTNREKLTIGAIVLAAIFAFNMYRAQNVSVMPNTGFSTAGQFTPGATTITPMPNRGVVPNNMPAPNMQNNTGVPRPVGSLRLAFPDFAAFYPYNDIYVDNAGQYFHQNGVWITLEEIAAWQNASNRGWDTAGKIGRDGQEISDGIIRSGEYRNHVGNKAATAFSEATLGTGHFYYNGNEYRVNDNTKTYFAYPNGNIGYAESPGLVPGGCQIMQLQ